MISGGSLTVSSTRARIQAVRNVQTGDLRLSLLDMEEGGKAGDAVTVAASDTYTLPGWPDSEVSSLEVTVDDYDALLALVKNVYSGRLTDVLYLNMGV
jgi:hypothetical protein